MREGGRGGVLTLVLMDQTSSAHNINVKSIPHAIYMASQEYQREK